MKFWKNMVLWKKILIAMFLGIIFGIFFREEAQYLKPVGDIFLKLLKVVAVPIIFTSIIYGITSIKNTAELGRIGLKAFSIYLTTTFFAVLFGLVIAMAIKPGETQKGDFELPEKTQEITVAEHSVSDTFVNMFPSNIFSAFTNGDVLQIIAFAIIFGIAANMSGEAGKRVEKINSDILKVIEQFVHIVIEFAPYGVFALLGYIIGEQGVEVLANLFWFFITFVIAASLHLIFVYGGMLVKLTRYKVGEFLEGAAEAQIFAFSTSSSSATLPVTLEVAKEKLKISEKVRGLVLPLGSTVNMDGTALYQGICVVFVAQLYGIDLTWIQLATVVFTAVVASIGTAGVPGVSLVTLSIIFEAVGLPLEGIAIILGIDRLIDMLRTTMNVTGDLIVASVIDKSEMNQK